MEEVRSVPSAVLNTHVPLSSGNGSLHGGGRKFFLLPVMRSVLNDTAHARTEVMHTEEACFRRKVITDGLEPCGNSFFSSSVLSLIALSHSDTGDSFQKNKTEKSLERKLPHIYCAICLKAILHVVKLHIAFYKVAVKLL